MLRHLGGGNGSKETERYRWCHCNKPPQSCWIPNWGTTSICCHDTRHYPALPASIIQHGATPAHPHSHKHMRNAAAYRVRPPLPLSLSHTHIMWLEWYLKDSPCHAGSRKSARILGAGLLHLCQLDGKRVHFHRTTALFPPAGSWLQRAGQHLPQHKVYTQDCPPFAFPCHILNEQPLQNNHFCHEPSMPIFPTRGNGN